MSTLEKMHSNLNALSKTTSFRPTELFDRIGRCALCIDGSLLMGHTVMCLCGHLLCARCATARILHAKGPIKKCPVDRCGADQVFSSTQGTARLQATVDCRPCNPPASHVDTDLFLDVLVGEPLGMDYTTSDEDRRRIASSTTQDSPSSPTERRPLGLLGGMIHTMRMARGILSSPKDWPLRTELSQITTPNRLLHVHDLSSSSSRTFAEGLRQESIGALQLVGRYRVCPDALRALEIGWTELRDLGGNTPLLWNPEMCPFPPSDFAKALGPLPRRTFLREFVPSPRQVVAWCRSAGDLASVDIQWIDFRDVHPAEWTFQEVRHMVRTAWSGGGGAADWIALGVDDGAQLASFCVGLGITNQEDAEELKLPLVQFAAFSGYLPIMTTPQKEQFARLRREQARAEQEAYDTERERKRLLREQEEEEQATRRGQRSVQFSEPTPRRQ